MSDGQGAERAWGGRTPEASASPAVATEGLTISFGGLRACDDVTFTVPVGERRVVIGPNGAGKTTLFNLIAGQLVPSGGRILLNGRDVTGHPAYTRARIGLSRTFQITTLMGAMTVWRNALLAVAGTQPRIRSTFWRPLASLPEVAEPAAALLDRWELAAVRDRTVNELAYGQQRLLEIVLALASRPKVLLLDEPTAGLSRPEANLMTDVALSLPDDLTLLVIEHDMRVAFAIGDVVQVMVDGAILATGTPEDVQRNDEVITAYLGGRLDAA